MIDQRDGDAEARRARPALSIPLLLVAGLGFFVLGAMNPDIIVRFLPEPAEEPRTAPPQPRSASWREQMRPHCNAVEVAVQMRRNPPPDTALDHNFEILCYALAGQIDVARERLEGLSGPLRETAAQHLFQAVHPVADAGGEMAAGPAIALAADYLPQSFMALYHAGMYQYGSGDSGAARESLSEFLRLYQQDDGWTRNAKEVLQRLASAPPPAAAAATRPETPARAGS